MAYRSLRASESTKVGSRLNQRRGVPIEYEMGEWWSDATWARRTNGGLNHLS